MWMWNDKWYSLFIVKVPVIPYLLVIVSAIDFS